MIKNKKGIALIVTLVLAAISVILIGVLMNLVITGTKISGVFKQYTSALEAAKGGMEDFISSMGTFVYYKGLSTDNESICKIQQDTDNWGESCKSYMKAKGYTEAELSSHSSVEDIIDYPDMVKDFGNYKVYVKLIDAKGAADGWYYTVDVVSQSKSDSRERAWLTVFLKTD
ncbi:pilus assembly PilX N-terminal domain-containing protein [Hippea alviniae]|uniref:pilus assembly PilX N-terminal domain-containing protein n=1 Tax=Hippea alviniae TaxID=1279027 RepID=UPI0003B5E5AB|nr:pilus assembly PilX N-terminal domain-containing protein [Hippea alviniae]